MPVDELLVDDFQEGAFSVAPQEAEQRAQEQ